MPRKPPPPPRPTTILQRTPPVEWIAAGLGLALTVGVIGASIFEAVTADDGPPALAIRAERVTRGPSGYVVEIEVRNSSVRTAADVEIAGRLEAGSASEERRARFSYVPGRGAVRGGLGFAADPRKGRLSFAVIGYADP
jgi:uncharacterized protein (TIGR02588 family)